MHRPDFEDLVDRFHEPLYRFAYSLTRSQDGAADLTQQTFYLWAAKGHQLRDSSKVKSWLFTTLHREFLTSRRRATRFPHESIDDTERQLPAIQPSLVNRLDSGAVMDALAAVEETYRAPLTLFYMEQLSYQEIADVLGIPIGTVMSRLSRGKEQLRKMLSLQADADAISGGKIVPMNTANPNRMQSHG